ncbi:hypothetical protein [Nocardia gipuzkoensis]|uniref:hypothetical protein n=1 Tax=Nocardia gipuzkoensis TaxID=2749991 RepID=UPI00237E7C29|nr:hypothetical protein [Nocardia gipuzkoensis]MDE1672681.1 hypothetical protein [Nocardia gipuzkoensis]
MSNGLTALQALRANGLRPLSSAPEHVVTGIRLPVYQPIAPGLEAGHHRVPAHVTLVGIDDLRWPRVDDQPASIEPVSQWRELIPDADAPPVVAVLRPRRVGTVERDDVCMLAVHLATVHIDERQVVHRITARFGGRLVATASPRWTRVMADRLGYPAPQAVQLWDHITS